MLRILDRAEQVFGQKQAVAGVIGIEPSRYSKVYNGTDPYPFSVETCLRLAKAVGESPSAVLRAADKDKIADMLDLLYGRSVPEDFIERMDAFAPPDLAAGIRSLARLPETARAPILALAAALAEILAPQPTTRRDDPRAHDTGQEARASATGKRIRRVSGHGRR